MLTTDWVRGERNIIGNERMAHKLALGLWKFDAVMSEAKPSSVRRAMFIDAMVESSRPPSGGRCL